MSFSSDVKNELYGNISKARHCQIAELSAIISFGCRLRIDGNESVLELEQDNNRLQRKFFSLINKTHSFDKSESVSGHKVIEVLKTTKIIDDEKLECVELDYINKLIIQQPCCKKAFIRGAFLSAGTISDPNKSYHFEIVAITSRQAEELREILEFFEVRAKIVSRKNHFVVYLKEGSQIVDVLNVMGAHKSLMDLENVRIVKEMRNSVNRKVNCETANISKMINASVKQIEDIEYIEKTIGLSNLPDVLGEMANVRLEHPDTPLKELGEYLSTPIGKSGVNHRLRRISEIADKLRNQEE